ncbi:histidyl-tRNA synthetase [Georgenia satyanarayanai]|uniref:Histidine--tRNA ligase n=1 Tax=Georgenia satyanarayanai TaxID=860221 RepID=A0A2Y8ZXU1_9MICO|nr:histidine--tRNA ligase [Georgenia satyanarayanai]PYG02093.1 histidyl-tRNA synthetase [Georgenia satyanarayanai]SSA36904.1 histidyl-tRNA synthetase [Georgenia satyanarayanai]
MARPTPLSGFPEWLPAERAVETHVLDVLRRTFELHGFAGIETRAVEPVEELLRKGETSKEVYAVSRLHDEDGASSEKRLGLHFDLTVPLARYVLEHAGKLVFPFKRYQIQKVWRGERPQEGRFREFTQADVDVVGSETLPFHYEVELPLVMAEALSTLPIPPVRIAVNNRKIAEGFYTGIGLTDVEGALRAIDKLAKIGPDAVAELLEKDAGATPEQARQALELAAVNGIDASVAERVRALGVSTPLLEEGLSELVALVEAAEERVPGTVVADLSIARGLDYYTGSVYETTLVGHEDLGSICSGGRYDSLASDGSRTYPGVGLSIGVSRLVARILGAGLATASRAVPTAVLVAVGSEEERRRSEDVAAALRARGIPTDVAPTAAKFGKQIRHADRLGIPFVWFPGAEGDEVKDIRSGDQAPADPASWAPPAEDLLPSVQRT